MRCWDVVPANYPQLVRSRRVEPAPSVASPFGALEGQAQECINEQENIQRRQASGPV